MKNIFKIALIALLLPMAAACTRVAPDPGEEGVMVRKPWFFGHGGVVEDPAKTGLSFAAWTTSVYYINVRPQSFAIEFKDMMSQDGIPLDFHATITLQVTDSVDLVKNFGASDWYKTNIEPVLNNYVRDAFKGSTMHSLAIEASGAEVVETVVRGKMIAYIAQHRIPLRVVNFTLGRVNPPEEIKRQRVKTAEEQQRQETEKQTKIAEDNRKAAESARAEADNAYRQSMSLSPEQFVELQRIQMMRDVCDNKGCTFIAGNASALVNTK